jgi:hypothetical protein
MHATRPWPLWPVAVATVVRLLVWAALPHTHFASDEDSYHRVATALVTTGEQDLFWPPGTGWLIALVATILRTTDPRWLRLAWIAIDIGCVLAVRVLAARIAGASDPRIDARRFVTLATLAYALYLPAIAFSQFTTSETPALLGVLGAAALITGRTLSAWHAAGAGLLLGGVAITRPSLLPLLLFVPAALWLGQRAPLQLRRAAVVVVVAATVVSAVVVRNLWMGGGPTIAQNSAYNLYIGNRDLYAEDLDLFHPVATAGQIEFRRQYWSGTLDYPTESPAALQRAALAWIAEHPGQFARRALGRLARVFAPKTDVLELLGGERRAGIFSAPSLALLTVANAQWIAVLFGGLVGLVALWRMQPPLGTVFAAIVLGSLPLCLVAISKPRYAFTFEPLLLLAAMYVLFARAQVAAALARRHRWFVAACAAFLVWGWGAWIVFAITSRVGLASAP